MDTITIIANNINANEKTNITLTDTSSNSGVESSEEAQALPHDDAKEILNKFLYSSEHDLIQYHVSNGMDKVTIEKVGTIVDNLYDLLTVSGYIPGNEGTKARRSHLKGYLKLKHEYLCYVHRYGFNSWAPLYKWKICSFFSCIFGDDPIKPPHSDPIFDKPFNLLKGRAMRFLRKLARKQEFWTPASVNNDSSGLKPIYLFATDVLMSKKGCPPVDESMVYEKRLETFNKLTAEPKLEVGLDWEGNEIKSLPFVTIPSWNVMNPNSINFYTSSVGADRQMPMLFHHLGEFQISSEIRRTVRELFRGKKFSDSKLYKGYFPSTSANYNWTREDGGGVEAVRTEINRLGMIDLDPYSKLYNQRFQRIIEFQKIMGKFAIGPLRPQDENYQTYFTRSAWDMRNGVNSGTAKATQGFIHLHAMEAVVDSFKLEYGDHTGLYSDYMPGSEAQEHQKELDEVRFREDFFLVYKDQTIDFMHRVLIDELFYRIALQKNWNTETVGLPEPLKVRVITKGPAIAYYVAKGFQKFTHKVLREHKTFQLIGKPLTEDIVNAVFRDTQMKSLIDQTLFPFVLSGDYKASTDNIYSRYSEVAMEEICTIVRDDWDMKDADGETIIDLKRMLIQTLTGHRVQKPQPPKEGDHKLTAAEKKKKKEQDFLDQLNGTGAWEFKEQTHGQLMGSVTSFPILCLINAAVCRRAMEIDRNLGRYKLNDLPLLINGDDCVLSGTSGLKDIWEKISNLVGLESSVGKTYFSKNLLVMNSQHYYLVDRIGFYKEMKFVNLGLVTGTRKDGSKEHEPQQLSSLQKKLLETARNNCYDIVNKLFFKHNKKSLPKGIPYYMPIWAGGLGLIPPDTKDLRKDLIRLKNRMSKDNFRMPPPAKMEWDMDELQQKLIDGSGLGAFSGTYSERLIVNYHRWIDRNGPHANKKLDEEGPWSIEFKDSYEKLILSTIYTHDMDELRTCFRRREPIQKYYEREAKKWADAPDWKYEGILPSLTDLSSRKPKKNNAVILQSSLVRGLAY